MSHDFLAQTAYTTKLIGQLMQFVFRATYEVKKLSWF